MSYDNVPDDWGSYYTKCHCGNKYHASEGGCSCYQENTCAECLEEDYDPDTKWCDCCHSYHGLCGPEHFMCMFVEEKPDNSGRFEVDYDENEDFEAGDCNFVMIKKEDGNFYRAECSEDLNENLGSEFKEAIKKLVRMP